MLSAVKMDTFADFYTSRDAIAALEAGKVVILGGGTGLPYFSTDTAAVLRAAEIEADAVLLAKNIDGVYNADPRKDPTARRYDEITYADVIAKELKANGKYFMYHNHAKEFKKNNNVTLLEEMSLAMPEDLMGDIIGDINKRRGRIIGMNPTENKLQEVTGEVPISEMTDFSTAMRSITQGTATFTLEFARYEDVPANIASKVIAEAEKE